MKKILIIEDDPAILKGLEAALQEEHFTLLTATDGSKGYALAKRETVDLILLDVMLPGKDGFTICRELRSEGIETPILMLTSKKEEIDKVLGLELGADDYVTKPFGVRELLARIHALLRRGATPTPADAAADANPFLIGDASIDPRTFQITRQGASTELTAKELKLLQLFHQHPGEVLSRDRLLTEVWGYHYFGTTRTLDQVIVQLRKKLGDNGGEPRHLLTVHGVGYKLVL